MGFEDNDERQEKQKQRYRRVGFWIALCTFLTLFGLLVAGGIIGFIGTADLILDLWRK